MSVIKGPVGGSPGKQGADPPQEKVTLTKGTRVVRTRERGTSKTASKAQRESKARGPKRTSTSQGANTTQVAKTPESYPKGEEAEEGRGEEERGRQNRSL